MGKKTLQRLKKHAKKTHARKNTGKKTSFIDFGVNLGAPGDPQNALKTTSLPEETASGRLWDDLRASRNPRSHFSEKYKTSHLIFMLIIIVA